MTRRERLRSLQGILLDRFRAGRHSWEWHTRVVDAIEAEIFRIDVKATPRSRR
jgi:hypothetical protein